MPLIIDKKDIAAWIDPATPQQTVKKLMQPYDESLMAAHTISKEAINVRNARNFAEIKEEVKWEERMRNKLKL